MQNACQIVTTMQKIAFGGLGESKVASLKSKALHRFDLICAPNPLFRMALSPVMRRTHQYRLRSGGWENVVTSDTGTDGGTLGSVSRKKFHRI